MPNFSPNYGLALPLVNDPTDQDLWGGYLNGDMDEIDSLIKSALNSTPIPETASFSVSAPTTGSSAIGGSNAFYPCDATANSIIVSLPSAASAGAGFKATFKKIDVSANTVTLMPSGAELIDGAATLVLSVKYEGVTLISDGVEWGLFSSNANGSAPLNSPAFTGTPTAPTAAAGTTTTQVATTAFANPDQNLATAGHCELPGGLIMNWGNITIDASGSSVTFDKAYTSTVFGAYSGKGNGSAEALFTSISTTGMRVATSNGGPDLIYWFTIGK
jgi:hypothetical protein